MAIWYPAPLFHLRWSHRELDDGHGSSLTPPNRHTTFLNLLWGLLARDRRRMRCRVSGQRLPAQFEVHAQGKVADER